MKFSGFSEMRDGFCVALDGSGAEIHAVPSFQGRFAYWPKGCKPREMPARRALSAYQIDRLFSEMASRKFAREDTARCWDSWTYPTQADD